MFFPLVVSEHPAVRVAVARYLKSTRGPAQDRAALLGRITQVHVFDAHLVDLPPLSVFPAAKRLVASHNEIEELPGPAGRFEAQTLEDVDLSCNRLRAVPAVGGPRVFTLFLQENSIRHAVITARLPSLLELSLASQRCGGETDAVIDQPETEGAPSRFADSVRQNAPRLRCLDVSGTGMTGFGCLAGITSLTRITARDNPLAEVDRVAPHLPPDLVLLDLSGCPVSHQRTLFEQVCARCPKLQEFNGKQYTADQVQFSAQKARRGQRAGQGSSSRRVPA